MSEERTEDIKQKYDTRPTIETVLEGINGLRAEIQDFRQSVTIRLDRIEAEVKATHSELFTLRADFAEFKRDVEERLPALKS